MEKSAQRVKDEFIDILKKENIDYPSDLSYIRAGQNAKILAEMYKLKKKSTNPNARVFKQRFNHKDLQEAYRTIINDSSAVLEPDSPQEMDLLLTLYRYR